MNKKRGIVWGLVSVLGLIAASIFSYTQFTRKKPASLDELLAVKWLGDWPKWLDFPLRQWANDGLDWLVTTYGYIFDAINNFIVGVYSSLTGFLVQTPWPVFIIGAVLLTYLLGRKGSVAAIIAAALFTIGLLSPKLWDKMIETSTLVIISIFICMIIGFPVAIAMSRSKNIRNMVLPILDLMQTIPSFVYLIPGVMLFDLGAVPAIIATVIYSVPPVIRLTDLGIRMIDSEVLEAAESFGATPMQKLRIVQLPLALPTIMQGINQTTMMALAMVVVASMVGTRGLGDEVLLGLQQQNVGRALEAGLAIVLLAIVLDRMTQAYGNRLQERKTDKG
jgi:glycine betaine/proline transport system permease protein